MTLSRIGLTQHLVDGVVPDDLDLVVGEQPLLQDAFGAELVAPVHHHDRGGELGEEQGFLDGGIAAADDHDLLAAVEEAVAGGAGRDAEALEAGLAFQPQPLGLGAGGDDQGLGQPLLAGVADEAEGAGGEVGRDHDVVDELGADVCGLLAHLVHQPRPLDHLGVSRIVLHVSGDGQLPAGREPADHHRVQQGAGGIDRRRITGRPSPHDQTADGTRGGHGFSFRGCPP